MSTPLVQLTDSSTEILRQNIPSVTDSADLFRQSRSMSTRGVYDSYGCRFYLGKPLQSLAMPMTTRRGTHEAHEKRRPKRHAPVKTIDDTVGLSWKEEKELKKALYASLQESRRQLTRSVGEDDPGPPVLDPMDPPPETSSRRSSASLCAPLPLAHPLSRRASWNGSQTVSRTGSLDDSSQDSNRSSLGSFSTAPQSQGKRTKIHAQRKFAQGSLPCSPSSTPVSMKTSPIKLLPKTAKTEDFLTFLCLRGSSVLPPHLDFSLKVNDENGEVSHQIREERSKTASTRESTPDSCSASSSTNEELYETVTPSLVSLISALMNGKSLASRKAARASASTPETARGIISLRQGMSSKASGLVCCSSSSRRRKYPGDRTPTPHKTPRLARKDMSPHTERAAQRAKRTPQFSPSGKFLHGRSSLLHPPSKQVERLRQASSKDRHQVSSLKSSTKTSLRSPHGTFRPVEPAAKNGGKISTRRSGQPSKMTRRQDRQAPSSRQTGRDTASALRDKQSHKKWPRTEAERSSAARRKTAGRRTSLRLRALKKSAMETRRHRSSSISTAAMTAPAPSPESSDGSRGPQAAAASSSPEGVSTRRSQRAEGTTSLPKGSSPSKSPSASPTRKTPQKTSSVQQRRLAKIIERRRSNSRSDDKAPGTSQKPSPSKTPPTLSSPKSASKRVRKTPGSKHALAAERSIKLEPFPQAGDPAQVVDVPIFYPSPEEFHDPLAYIQVISTVARPYGMCKVVPPASWKMESKINEDMRFTVQIQYIHKLHKRWGPAVQREACIYQHLHNMGASLERSPQVGGVEVDLSRLSQTVKDSGGLQNVVDKKCWMKIADVMRIPKLAQDRGTKLYDIYCKYVLPYDTLSAEEKARLEQAVLGERQRKERLKEEDEECFAKGRSRPLGAFKRVACNVQSMWFKSNPSPEQVENEYWQIVEERNSHVAVQCGHVFSQSTAFPVRRDSPYIRHGWNLNNLRQNSSSVLRCLGPVPGVTMPSLHAGMLFSTSCWSSSPHDLPFIQYLHCGSDIIWYSVPEQEQTKMKAAMTDLAPTLISEKAQCLKKDAVMVHADTLVEKGVSVGHCVQRPRQFVVVFPRTHTSNISCGYSLSESVHFAFPDWINVGLEAAKVLHSSHQEELFSMEGLLIQLAQDPHTPPRVLAASLPHLLKVKDREIQLRRQLYEAGLTISKRMVVADALAAASPQTSKTRKRTHSQLDAQETMCDVTKKICFLSMVVNDQEDVVLSLEAGLNYIQKKRNLKQCRLLFRLTEDELKSIIQRARERIETSTSEPSKKRTPKKVEGRA